MLKSLNQFVPAVWLYRGDEWDHQWKPTLGSDEFLRRTLVIRLAKQTSFVISYRRCFCEHCQIARSVAGTQRVTEKDREFYDEDYTIEDDIYFMIKVWKRSGNRLSLPDYLGWTQQELNQWTYFNSIPKE